MNVIKISPRGYCYGVVDAMVLALKAAQNLNLPRPIYILGMIVHNAHVTDSFSQKDIISLEGENRLEILKEVTQGTVIFTAHGVSPQVRELAITKGLTVVDATCPDVTKTHKLIKEKIDDGYHVIYIGKKGHPEPEGACGISPSRVHLVENVQEIQEICLSSEQKIVVTNQTTMSQWDVKDLIHAAIKKFPQAQIHNEICLATQLRQEAVVEGAKEADLVIVVGDPKSNNSNRLAQVSEEIAKVRAYRITDISEIKLEWLKGIKNVAVTSGASTPTPITREVIQYLEQFDWDQPKTWEKVRTVKMDRLLPNIRERSKES